MALPKLAQQVKTYLFAGEISKWNNPSWTFNEIPGTNAARIKPPAGFYRVTANHPSGKRFYSNGIVGVANGTDTVINHMRFDGTQEFWIAISDLSESEKQQPFTLCLEKLSP